MKETFLDLINYLKNPTLQEDENKEIEYRLVKFCWLLAICLLTGLAITPIFSIIENFGLINMEDHAMEDMMKTLSKPVIFLMAVGFAPLFEEIIFRAPLTLFKKQNTFKIFFYLFAILFGFVHLFNFTITQNVLILAPILVAPQILLGCYLGFIRVRFGLLWSIALHACYNGILMLITFSAELF